MNVSTTMHYLCNLVLTYSSCFAFLPACFSRQHPSGLWHWRFSINHSKRVYLYSPYYVLRGAQRASSMHKTMFSVRFKQQSISNRVLCFKRNEKQQRRIEIKFCMWRGLEKYALRSLCRSMKYVSLVDYQFVNN